MSEHEPPDEPQSELRAKVKAPSPFRVIETPPSNGADVLENEHSAPDAQTASVRGANDEEILIQIAHLEDEHHDLGLAIDAMQAQSPYESLSIARLKKKKLRLKDRIIELKNSLTPDIIA